jgi:hypothetical protein
MGHQQTGSLTANLGINMPTGQTYNINDSALTTVNILQGANKYFTNALATTAITGSALNVASLTSTGLVTASGHITTLLLTLTAGTSSITTATTF